MKLFCRIGVLWFLTTLTLLSQQPPDRNNTVTTIVSEVSRENLKTIVQKLVSFETRHTLSDTVSETRGIGAARRWIKSEFERYAKQSNGRLKVEFQEGIANVGNRVPRPTRICNVVATLQPRSGAVDSDRLFLVTGHYDTRAGNPMDTVSAAPGANDDGSGIALVLELARVLSKHEFEATIVFIAFAGEEQGLLGANQWSEMARQARLRVQGVLNNDMVGNTISGDGTVESSYVRLYSEALSPLDTGSTLRMRNTLGQENDGPSRTLARYVQEVGERYVPGFGIKMIYRRDRFLRGGDHSPFHDRGFAAVRIVDVKENYDHQHQNTRTEDGKRYGDLVDFMDFNYLARNARVNIAVLASLALAPAGPAGVGVMTTQLAYDTKLRWNKNRESDLAGYFVRYRETSAAQWHGGMFTTDTTATLKLSKDDFLFGVQAVDKEGNASLISLPVPVR
jgi:hypothetical protein